MIISHRKKFIFVHIFKAAGNNIRIELRNHSFVKSKKNRLLSFFGIQPKFFSEDMPNHATATQIQAYLPNKIFSSYFKFAFVRNPWAWQVSLFHFMKQNSSHHQYNIIKDLSFEEYIDWRVNNDVKYQKDFLYDKYGNLLIDFVGKIETIQTDFDSICEILNIEKRRLTIHNSSKHAPYRDYYNSVTKEIINQVFAEDIKLFDYTFET